MAVKTSVPAFNEYPLKMQRQLISVCWYERLVTLHYMFKYTLLSMTRLMVCQSHIHVFTKLSKIVSQYYRYHCIFSMVI